MPGWILMFGILAVCELAQGVRERPRLSCMRCFDVAGDGTSYFLAGSKSADELMKIWRNKAKDQEEEELVARSDDQEDIQPCPKWENATVQSVGSTAVTSCELWEVCTTIQLAVNLQMRLNVDFDMELAPVNASFTLLTTIRGCSQPLTNDSMKACQSFENQTWTAELPGDEENDVFPSNITLMARGCLVKSCEDDLCNYNSAATRVISWGLLVGVTLWRVTQLCT